MRVQILFLGRRRRNGFAEQLMNVSSMLINQSLSARTCIQLKASRTDKVIQSLFRLHHYSNHNRNKIGSHRLFHSSKAKYESQNNENFAFDRNMKRLQRDAAARIHVNQDKNMTDHDASDPMDYDYFQKEIALRLVDRLDDIKREEGFPLALDIGTKKIYIYFKNGR